MAFASARVCGIFAHGHVRRRWMCSRTPSKGDRVVVAMSGGVDSSVAAKLLADQDYDLSAIFMRNWDTRDESATDTGCEWEKDWEDVQRVCRLLDLPCKMIDLSREYWTRVFGQSLRAWESGETPNPDVTCNREIKFGALLDRLTEDPDLGSNSWLATGHYARRSWSDELPYRPKLLRSADPTKDQTYYLSAISESSLRRALFPLGDLTKQQVREIAKRHGLPTAHRAESMGVCFVGERRKFSEFISQYIEPSPGPIVDPNGKRIGTHQGLWTYTVGQGARLMGMREKMFVATKNQKLNQITVVPGTDNRALYRDVVLSTDFRWIWSDAPPPELDNVQGFQAQTQFRHRMPEEPCTVQKLENEDILISFKECQKAVALGQVIAVWKGNWCLGSGTIKDTW